MKTWTTQEGKVLPIEKMKTSHIKNCIAMLKRRLPDLPKYGEYVTADHWSLPGIVYEPGQDDYQKQIDAFEKELSNRV